MSTNPFNGSIFALGAAAPIVVGVRLGQAKIEWGPWPIVLLGGLSLCYGFYGAAVLGLTMDWTLFAGAVFLLALSLKSLESAH